MQVHLTSLYHSHSVVEGYVLKELCAKFEHEIMHPGPLELVALFGSFHILLCAFLGACTQWSSMHAAIEYTVDASMYGVQG